MPTSVGINWRRRNVRHRCPRRRSGPERTDAGRVAGQKGVATTVVDRQPAGANTSRAAVVNARTLEVLEDLDVSRRLVKEGVQAPRFTIRDGRRTLIPVDFSVLPTALPVLADGPAGDHRATAARSADRARRHGDPAEDADVGGTGRRRRDRHIRGRRRDQGALRRRRGRHAQHRARAGGHRLRRRRATRSRSPSPTSGCAARHRSTRSSCSGRRQA